MNLHGFLLLLTILATGLAVAGAVYITILALVGTWSQNESESTFVSQEPGTHFLVLIPAHNEEEGIGPTLESLHQQDYPGTLVRLIVIADNCNDGTASIVRQAGFECWERNEPTAPGKGQALRWALDRLTSSSWDAAVFIDADTRIGPEFLTVMDRQIQEGVVAIQARYEFELPDQSCLSLLTFASKSAENSLFWRPRERFGWMGFIVGNGFCLKREVLRAIPWAAYSIVEDVEYSLQLAMHGVRVKYVETTRVISRATRRRKDAAPQRLRWASGTFQLIRNYVPKLLQSGVKSRSLGLIEMALALTLTSRIFLFYLTFLAASCSLLLSASSARPLLRIMVVVSVLLLCVYTGMVLSQIPKIRGSRFRALVTLPCYLSWMIFVHAAAFIGVRRGMWVRTTR
jgi:cellulose synthase/poly-beta-1,6-N-acetylglucosamine synthase-like glycosyltransferase